MLENGFVKLHRSLLKWEWYDDLNTFKLFMHLLLTVNYYDRQWRGKTVKRGSRITSYAILAKETKLSIKSVRTAIKHLISTGEVAKVSNSEYTIITVNNYDKYQDAANEQAGEGQAKGKQGAGEGQAKGKQGAGEGQQSKKDKESNKNEKEGPPVPADAPDGAAYEMTREERLEKIKRLRR